MLIFCHYQTKQNKTKQNETSSKLCDLEKFSLQNVRSESHLRGEREGEGMVRQLWEEQLEAKVM